MFTMGLKENFKQAAKELMEVPGKSNAAEPSATASRPISVQKPAQEAAKKLSARPKQATLIAAGTVIQGAIQTAGDLELQGEVQGDITGTGNLRLCGKLGGNAAGANIELCGVRMKGDVTATGRVQIDDASVIIGSLRADSLMLNGKLKGDITVNQELHLEDHAVAAGKIIAGRLTVAEGAVILGEVRLAGADAEKYFRDETGEKVSLDGRPV